MKYTNIKYLLTKHGYSFTRVASELGLDRPQVIQQVLMRKYFSARVEKFIAEITGVPLEELFPDRYQRPEHSKKK